MALLYADLRRRRDDDFRFPLVQLNLSGHSNRFPVVLLRVGKLVGSTLMSSMSESPLP